MNTTNRSRAVSLHRGTELGTSHINAIIWLVLVLIGVSFGFSVVALGDGIGFTAPGPVRIIKAEPLSATESIESKINALNEAIDDSDFVRVTDLFSKCASEGDAVCQYALASGYRDWQSRTDNPPSPVPLSPTDIRALLRSAHRSDEALPFVSGEWRIFYMFGYYGFPKDDELSLCWGHVLVGNVFDLDTERRIKASKCKRLEDERYGNKAHWLID